MALPSENIRVGLVNRTIKGGSFDIGTLCTRPNINPFSRYAPGRPGVDANKNIVFVAPSAPFILDDFRLYNHQAEPPQWWSLPGSIYWGPGGTANVQLNIAMGELNLDLIPNIGIDRTTEPWHFHLRADIYNTEYDRRDSTGLVQSLYPIEIDLVPNSPLVGHSRQSTWVPNTGFSGNAIQFNGVYVTGPECTRYFEVYICDISGNRVANLGTTRDAGFTQVAFHERQTARITHGVHFTPLPAPISGVSWTFVAPMVSDTTAPESMVSPITMTPSQGGFTFYVKARGICGTPAANSMWNAGISSCDIHLIVTEANGDTFDQTIATGQAIVADSAGYYCNGTLAGGRTWQLDWSAVVVLTNVVWSGVNKHCPLTP